MTQRFLLLMILAVAASCQYFDTEKVTSDEIYENEIQTIDWKEVDQYPSFPECEAYVEKDEQKNCFINVISSTLYNAVGHRDMVAVREVYDTVKVRFEVGNSGDLSIVSIEMDSILEREFPLLERAIYDTLDSLQPIAPAYKRGIPVKTEFVLPIIVQTD